MVGLDAVAQPVRAPWPLRAAPPVASPCTVATVARLEVRPVGPDQLHLLRSLFDSTRQTRHCWCTAFCSTRWQFARGWYGKGNQRRLETMAQTEPDPVGLIALLADNPIGWCACGPRARYTVGSDVRSKLAAERELAGAAVVWHVACFFVRPDQQGGSVVVSMLREAISLARNRGASAIEGWPLPLGHRSPAQAHVGREGIFARLGFEKIEQPAPGCVIMHLDLT